MGCNCKKNKPNELLLYLFCPICRNVKIKQKAQIDMGRVTTCEKCTTRLIIFNSAPSPIDLKRARAEIGIV